MTAMKKLLSLTVTVLVGVTTPTATRVEPKDFPTSQTTPQTPLRTAVTGTSAAVSSISIVAPSSSDGETVAFNEERARDMPYTYRGDMSAMSGRSPASEAPKEGDSPTDPSFVPPAEPSTRASKAGETTSNGGYGQVLAPLKAAQVSVTHASALADLTAPRVLSQVDASDSSEPPPPAAGGADADSETVAYVDPTGIERGGGDELGLEFHRRGEAFIKDLAALQAQGKYLEIDLAKVQDAVDTYRVDLLESPAINTATFSLTRSMSVDTTAKVITVKEEAWYLATSTLTTRVRITVAAYLIASGYPALASTVAGDINSHSRESRLFNLSDFEVDTRLFLSGLGESKRLRCAEVARPGKIHQFQVDMTEFGVRVLRTIPTGSVSEYSDRLRSLLQVTYGERQTTISVGALSCSHTWVFETPKAGATALQMVQVAHCPGHYAEGAELGATSMSCQVVPR